MMVADAYPGPYAFPKAGCALLVIDPQVDFMEPGGWAEAIGLDVGQLAGVVPVIADLLARFRREGMTVIFTREGYRPDLADCPPAKRGRYAPRIGDQGPKGRYMITGEPCNDIIEALRPQPGEVAPPRRRAPAPTPSGWCAPTTPGAIGSTARSTPRRR
jgi:nicotinamidase-related amidase